MGEVTPNDDEDWLYRRGNHAPGDPESDATRVLRPGDAAAKPAVPTTPPPPPLADRLPPPTPVGHYGPPGGQQPPVPPAASRPAASPPAASRPVARRRRHPVRIALVVLALVLVYLVGIPAATWSGLERTQITPTGKRPSDTPGTLFVLAGSDSREGLSPEEQAKLGTGNDAGRRSDTLMLLYVPPLGKAALISVPRDSYVAIPGHGKNKINAAYSFGGPTLLVQTVEQATGLRVDGYAEIGFGGFAAMVDAVGGIEVCPKEAIADRDSNLNVPAGCQTFDGPTALGYVRMRKADPLGDLGRVQRQREVLGVLAKKVVSPATVLLPSRYWGVNAAGARALTIGADTGPLELGALGVGVVKIATGDGLTLTVPVGTTDLHTAAGSAVAWDDKAAKELFAEIARGDTSRLDRFAK